MDISGRSTPVRTTWKTLVAVCRDCEGGKAVAKVLKREFKAEHRRDVRVIRTSCLDVCPKHGVTVSVTESSGVETIVLQR